jgi:hypothetical protein
MNRQSWLAGATGSALDSFLAHAEAFPEDKRTWRPLGQGRSLVSLILGVASMADWSEKVARENRADPMSEEDEKAYRELTSREVPYGEALEGMKEAVHRAVEAIRAMPDESLDVRHALMPEWSMSTFECAASVHWQLTYTLGQAAYVQTLFGDMGMHLLPTLTRPDLVGTDGRADMAAAVDETVGMIIRAYEATPEERMHWRPEEGCRTIHEVAAECAQAFSWSAMSIRNRGMTSFDEEEAQKEVPAIFEGGIKEAFDARIQEWKSAVEALAQADLDAKVDMFAPGWQESLHSCAYYPVWNLSYHYGQLSYIQTLYGDQAMH